MPQVEITIGGRSFEVACQEGEEHYLQSAAAMLNAEADHLSGQIGRMPEARMLLMAGLMLADKTAGLEDKLREAQGREAELQSQNDMLRARGAEQVQVPVVPQRLTDSLSEIAAQAEALADELDARSAQ